MSGAVRRAQLITTYGVGSIVAADDESFMVAGIDRWEVGEPDLHEPRLERELRVPAFAEPPAGDGAAGIPVVKFPRWQSCPQCRRLAPYKDFGSVFDNKCQECGVTLVPSRFVAACPHGHIEDFPYFMWVHGRGVKRSDKHRLKLSTNAATASLRAIEIRCSCGAARTMEEAFNRFALKEVVTCQGSRPWLTTNDEKCGQMLRTLQRGASNVWFANTRSALSIPPWSEGAYKMLNKHWSALRYLSDEASLVSVIKGMKLAENSEYSVEDLVGAVKRRQDSEGGESPGPLEMRAEEYEALVKGKAEEAPGQEFVAVSGEVPASLSNLLEQVTLVKRLREVRALTGFHRLQAASADIEPAPLSVDDVPWLPAIDVLGEGVFLRFNESELANWELEGPVIERAKTLDDRYQSVSGFWNAGEGRVITARFLMIHTFAHALINQWALEAGYPAASLRERLYVSDSMAGVLLYTATSDAAGSLGGVVSQATPKRLESSIREAIDRFAWCSADPVCAEAEAAGVDSLNMAACHSCALLPETSCEERNTLLDRGLLVGSPETPKFGFFSERITA